MITPFQLEIRQYVKALVGGILAALAALGGALGDGLSSQEVIGLFVAFLGGFAGVFYTPNLAAQGRLADPDLSEQNPLRSDGEVGIGQVGLIVLVVLAVLFVLFLLLPALGASL